MAKFIFAIIFRWADTKNGATAFIKALMLQWDCYGTERISQRLGLQQERAEAERI